MKDDVKNISKNDDLQENEIKGNKGKNVEVSDESKGNAKKSTDKGTNKVDLDKNGTNKKSSTDKVETKKRSSGMNADKSETKKKSSEISADKSGAKKRSSGMNADKSETKKKSSEISVDKSGAKKRSSGMNADKSGAKKKSSGMSADKSETKKKSSEISADKSGAKKKSSGMSKDKEEPKKKRGTRKSSSGEDVIEKKSNQLKVTNKKSGKDEAEKKNAKLIDKRQNVELAEKISENGKNITELEDTEKEVVREKKPIENIMTGNVVNIRKQIKEKVIEGNLKSNLRANRIIEIVLFLGFVLSCIVVFLMWNSGKTLNGEISSIIASADTANPYDALLVVGGSLLAIGEKVFEVGDTSAVYIFITLMAVVVVLKIFGIYQAFKRRKYKDAGIDSQNMADTVIASVLLINTIILASLERTGFAFEEELYIKGIIIYDLVLTMLLVYGMNIRNRIKRYYKWTVASQKEL